MIDWLDFVVEVKHSPINAGHFLSINPDGEIEYDVKKSSSVRGSYDSTYRVRSQGSVDDNHASEVYLSGNPAKFLQGHNVFGIEDINDLASEVSRRIFETFAIADDLAVARIRRGDFSVKRIDVTHSYRFRSREEVKAVLSALSIKSRSRRGRPQTKGGTVYHGMNSRRHSFKFYSKGEELEAGKKHRLPEELKHTPIQDFADNLLRAELCLRSKELQDLGITHGRDLPPRKLRELFTEYFGRIEMAAQADIASEEIMSMSRAIRSTYLLWKEGVQVDNMFSRATFYRHRHALLAYGVDIALPSESSDCTIIPLFQTVTGEPVDVPGWAYEQGLVFTSH